MEPDRHHARRAVGPHVGAVLVEIAEADQIYSDSAVETGGEAGHRIRFVHDAGCQATVTPVVISPTGDDTFDNTIESFNARLRDELLAGERRLRAAPHPTGLKDSRGYRAFRVANATLLVLVMVVMLYPFVNIVAQSFSGEAYINAGQVNLVPRGGTASWKRRTSKRSPSSRSARVRISRSRRPARWAPLIRRSRPTAAWS